MLYTKIEMKKSFSLVEVVIFIAVLSIFFVGAASVTTYTLRGIQINEHRVLATHFAEQGMEWVRSEEEADWTTFITRDQNIGSTTYCINTLDWTSSGSCTTTMGSPQIFKREAIITNVPDSINPNSVDVTINVFWTEPSNDNQIASVSAVYKLIE